MAKYLLLMICSLIFVGCATWNRGVSYFHYKANLAPLPSDNRVLFDGSDSTNALKISKSLDSAINIVQEFYQTPFSKPVYITVCLTEESFIRHGGGYKNSEAITNWGRIFMAPLTFHKNNVIPVLVHELTHLHTQQKIGVVKVIGSLPAWFNEGLAVMVSNGAGAEEVNDSVATFWINQGKCIVPYVKGSFLKPSNNSNLPWDMFYRQSSLIVKFLFESNPNAFHLLLKDIENGTKFEIAFTNHYDKSIKDEFNKFKQYLSITGTSKKSS